MEFGFLFFDWLGKPAWMWLAFIAIVVVLLTLDLGVLHAENREIEARESLLLSAGYIGLALAFGAWVWWSFGAQSGMEYMTGFAIECPPPFSPSATAREGARLGRRLRRATPSQGTYRLPSAGQSQSPANFELLSPC